MKDWLRDKLLPAVLLAVIGAAISTWVQVQMLRADVDRHEVYIDQMWHQK